MRVGYNLVKLGFIEEIELTKMLARQYDAGRRSVAVRGRPQDREADSVRSREQEHSCCPLKRDGRTLTVAMADPTNVAAIEDLKFITRYDIFPVIAGEYTLRDAIEQATTSSPTPSSQSLLNERRGRRADLEVVAEMQDEEVHAVRAGRRRARS